MLLQKLRYTESDRLPIQVKAYLDNTIDVKALLEDSDTKNAALERVAELEEQLSFVSLPIYLDDVACLSQQTKLKQFMICLTALVTHIS